MHRLSCKRRHILGSCSLLSQQVTRGLCQRIAKCKETMCLPIHTLITQRFCGMIAKNGSLCNYALFFFCSSSFILFVSLLCVSIFRCGRSCSLFFFSFLLSIVEMCEVCCLAAQPVHTQIEGKIEIMFVHNYRECEKATMALKCTNGVNENSLYKAAYRRSISASNSMP